MSYAYLQDVNQLQSFDSTIQKYHESHQYDITKTVKIGAKIYYISTNNYDNYFNNIIEIRNKMKSGIVQQIDWKEKKILFNNNKKVTNMIILDLVWKNGKDGIPLLNTIYRNFVI